MLALIPVTLHSTRHAIGFDFAPSIWCGCVQERLWLGAPHSSRNSAPQGELTTDGVVLVNVKPGRLLEPGTVSHGTLRERDLLSAFSGTLATLVTTDSADLRLLKEADGLLELEEWTTEQACDAEDVLSELFEALGRYCPAGHGFGAHEGDGSDFGCWAYNDEDFDGFDGSGRA